VESDAAAAIARLENEAVELRMALSVAQERAGSQVRIFTGGYYTKSMYTRVSYSVCIYVCNIYIYIYIYIYMQNEAAELRAALVVAQERADSLEGSQVGRCTETKQQSPNTLALVL